MSISQMFFGVNVPNLIYIVVFLFLVWLGNCNLKLLSGSYRFEKILVWYFAAAGWPFFLIKVPWMFMLFGLFLIKMVLWLIGFYLVLFLFYNFLPEDCHFRNWCRQKWEEDMLE